MTCFRKPFVSLSCFCTYSRQENGVNVYNSFKKLVLFSLASVGKDSSKKENACLFINPHAMAKVSWIDFRVLNLIVESYELRNF